MFHSSRSVNHSLAPHPLEYIELDQYLSQFPALQSLTETMRTYFDPKLLLLFVFGILLVIRGIHAEDKAPPATLQIGMQLRKDNANCRSQASSSR